MSRRRRETAEDKLRRWADEVKRHHGEIVGHMRRAIFHAKDAGCYLNRAKVYLKACKKRHKHAIPWHWENWLSACVKVGKSTAYVYIRIYKNWEKPVGGVCSPTLRELAESKGLTIEEALRLLRHKKQAAQGKAPPLSKLELARCQERDLRDQLRESCKRRLKSLKPGELEYLERRYGSDVGFLFDHLKEEAARRRRLAERDVAEGVSEKERERRDGRRDKVHDLRVKLLEVCREVIWGLWLWDLYHLERARGLDLRHHVYRLLRGEAAKAKNEPDLTAPYVNLSPVGDYDEPGPEDACYADDDEYERWCEETADEFAKNELTAEEWEKLTEGPSPDELPPDGDGPDDPDADDRVSRRLRAVFERARRRARGIRGAGKAGAQGNGAAKPRGKAAGKPRAKGKAAGEEE